MAATPYAAAERKRQARWKATWPDLPAAARAPGRWGDVPVPFILPVDHAAQNLWDPDRWLPRFAADNIAWHMEDEPAFGPRAGPGPSPHLLDSQIACLNVWGGLEARGTLADVLRAFLPDVGRVVPPRDGGPLLEAEWIGLGTPLGERGSRRRGAFATSADLLLAYEDPRGQLHGVLVESKYTESYLDARPQRWSRHGTDRAEIYRPAFEAETSPIRAGVDLEALLIEPFDQLLRQQLLAAAMEASEELGFRTVRVLHASPRANRSFHEMADGSTVGEVWTARLRDPTRFVSVAYEDLFRIVRGEDAWCAWMAARYGFAA